MARWTLHTCFNATRLFFFFASYTSRCKWKVKCLKRADARSKRESRSQRWMNGNGNGNVITLTQKKRREEDSSFSIFSCVIAIKSTNKQTSQPTDQPTRDTCIPTCCRTYTKTVAKWREVVLFACVYVSVCVFEHEYHQAAYLLHKKASCSHLSTSYIFTTWVLYFIWQFHALLHSCSLSRYWALDTHTMPMPECVQDESVRAPIKIFHGVSHS